jgi:hypothetical protein
MRSEIPLLLPAHQTGWTRNSVRDALVIVLIEVVRRSS